MSNQKNGLTAKCGPLPLELGVDRHHFVINKDDINQGLAVPISPGSSRRGVHQYRRAFRGIPHDRFHIRRRHSLLDLPHTIRRQRRTTCDEAEHRACQNEVTMSIPHNAVVSHAPALVANFRLENKSAAVFN